MSTTDLQPDLIDLPTLARRLGVDQRHIRRLVAERRIPFVKWGYLLRFDAVGVDARIDRSRVPVRE
ncbi:MAG: excisionase family DNA-binding protein [Acidimicrobiia bacterium]